MLEALLAVLLMWLMAAIGIGVVMVLLIGLTRIALCARGVMRCMKS